MFLCKEDENRPRLKYLLPLSLSMTRDGDEEPKKSRMATKPNRGKLGEPLGLTTVLRLIYGVNRHTIKTLRNRLGEVNRRTP